MNVNRLFHWRKLYQRGRLDTQKTGPMRLRLSESEGLQPIGSCFWQELTCTRNKSPWFRRRHGSHEYSVFHRGARTPAREP